MKQHLLDLLRLEKIKEMQEIQQRKTLEFCSIFSAKRNMQYISVNSRISARTEILCMYSVQLRVFLWCLIPDTVEKHYWYQFLQTMNSFLFLQGTTSKCKLTSFDTTNTTQMFCQFSVKYCKSLIYGLPQDLRLHLPKLPVLAPQILVIGPQPLMLDLFVAIQYQEGH